MPYQRHENQLPPDGALFSPGVCSGGRAAEVRRGVRHDRYVLPDTHACIMVSSEFFAGAFHPRLVLRSDLADPLPTEFSRGEEGYYRSADQQPPYRRITIN